MQCVLGIITETLPLVEYRQTPASKHVLEGSAGGSAPIRHHGNVASAQFIGSERIDFSISIQIGLK
jgi:hypothetical protein